jgi:hypothetical protein
MAQIRLDRCEAEHGSLPSLCIVCGHSATYKKRVTFKKSRAGEEFHAVVLAPLCDAHRYHWMIRSAALPLSLIVLLVLGCAGGLALPRDIPGLWLVPGFGAFLAWCGLAFYLHRTSVHATEITQMGVVLTNVSPAFADAAQTQRVAVSGQIQDFAERIAKKKDEGLSQTEYWLFGLLFFAIPIANILVSSTLYYTWRKEQPKRASQINQMAWSIFLIHLLARVMIYAFLKI